MDNALNISDANGEAITIKKSPSKVLNYVDYRNVVINLRDKHLIN